MHNWQLPLGATLPRLTLTSVVDILIVAFLIYQLLSIIRGRRAAPILAGVGILILTYLASGWLHLELLRAILLILAPYTAFALIVMFQSELRRMLARLGRSRLFSVGERLKRYEAFDEVLLAVTKLADEKTGALIVMEHEIGLRTFIESGVLLDAHLSRDLLLSIFQPGGALHDGAAIVQGDRIAAAACFLPLTMNPMLAGKSGTRHRAGTGVTEEADCLAIIVSEESGQISIAAFGEIERHVTIEQLGERLIHHFGGKRRQHAKMLRGSDAMELSGPDVWGRVNRG
ncbi:MAG: TIGR00159 family protein [Bryobacterales bacterium]|nr:TIGR00159 family protein [Bryobacterales bacterium]